MKYYFILLTLFFGSLVYSQSIQGELHIEGKNKFEISTSNDKMVNLYAAFRENKYPIHFAFTADGVTTNNEKKEVVQFVFTTTIKRDGKTIGSVKRNPIPFFPGDMFMPVETFDFISILSNFQINSNDKISSIPAGNYEIILSASPVATKGKVNSLIIYLKVQD